MNPLIKHQNELKQCRLCPDMIPPVIVGQPVRSKIIAIGQAPGEREGEFGHPFAWTAGKTLFKWLASIGVSEAEYRAKVYMAAVCRCFPGKNPKGGDRVPNRMEIQHCRRWLEQEFELLQPELVIPIGKLAIAQILPIKKLTEAVGQAIETEAYGVKTTVIALPHPSGLSTWHRTEPGKTLLQQSLKLIKNHPAWQMTFNSA